MAGSGQGRADPRAGHGRGCAAPRSSLSAARAGRSGVRLPTLPQPFRATMTQAQWEQAPGPAQHLCHVFARVSGIQRSRSRFPRRTEGLALGTASAATVGLPTPCGVSELGIPSPQNPSEGLCCPWQAGSGRGGKRQTCAGVVGRAEAGQDWQGSPARAGLQGLPPTAPSLPPPSPSSPFHTGSPCGDQCPPPGRRQPLPLPPQPGPAPQSRSLRALRGGHDQRSRQMENPSSCRT